MKNWLEWTVFALSFVLVAVVLTLLIVDASRGAANEPDLRIHLGTPYPGSGGYVVPVVVENRSRQTAEGALIEVSAGGETAEVELQYVPRESQRTAWVVLSKQPSSDDLAARVLGYEKP